MPYDCFHYYLNDGRFTWRHDQMLQAIAKSLKSIPDSVLYVDLPGYITPSVISGSSLRPDLLLTVSSKYLYILELTVGFEANLLNIAIRKTNKYEDLVKRQKNQYGSVKFISLFISTLGVFSLHSTDFLNMLKETGFDDKHVNYIIRTLTIIEIRTTYYVFCKRGKIGTIQSCYLPNQILYFLTFVFTLLYLHFFCHL